MDIDLVLCCESWACIHLIMPTLFDNANDWMNAVELRQELPIECQGTISETRFHHDLNFIHFVQTNAFSRHNSHMFEYFCEHWQYDHGILNFLNLVPHLPYRFVLVQFSVSSPSSYKGWVSSEEDYKVFASLVEIPFAEWSRCVLGSHWTHWNLRQEWFSSGVYFVHSWVQPVLSKQGRHDNTTAPTSAFLVYLLQHATRWSSEPHQPCMLWM